MATAAIFVPDGRRRRFRGQSLVRRLFIYRWAGAAMAGPAAEGMLGIEGDGVAILADFWGWRWRNAVTGC